MNQNSYRRVIKELIDRVSQARSHLHSLMASEMLSDRTQKIRRNLLVASSISLAISILEFTPDKIEAFGVTFKPEQQSYLIWVLAAFTLYFLSSFFIHFLIEYRIYVHKIDSALLKFHKISNELKNDKYCFQQKRKYPSARSSRII